MINTNSIVYQSAEQLARAIREKTMSSVELATAFIKQIEHVNPMINAIFQVDPERILSQAQLLDEALSKGQLYGPLHGVPITIKDNLNTKGMVTTGGSAAFSGFIPETDATVVQRLRTSGAIILGKTNLPDFALAWETDSTAYGRTNNPYDLNRTSGGSSGGEAAIISMGGSAFGIGTDSGGSIRLPAHYCGIAGLRPSRGLIPSTGHMPPQEGYPVLGVFAHLNTIGPMARYVSDLMYVLPTLMGADGIDPYAEIPSVDSIRSFTLKGLKIALHSSVNGIAVNPDIDAVLYQTARKLAEQGAIITEATPPGLHEARDIYCAIVGADGGKGIRELLSELNYQHIPSSLQNSLKLIKKQGSLKKFLDAWIQWDFFRIKLLDFMQNYDLILCPVSASTALLHTETLTSPKNFAKENYLTPYSLMGWPALVVRAGTSLTGLPIGVQLVAKHRHDYQVLHAGLAVEQGIIR